MFSEKLASILPYIIVKNIYGFRDKHIDSVSGVLLREIADEFISKILRDEALDQHVKGETVTRQIWIFPDIKVVPPISESDVWMFTFFNDPSFKSDFGTVAKRDKTRFEDRALP